MINIMIKLKSILLENTYTYFYHATTCIVLPDIVKAGLLPSQDTHWGGDLGKFSKGKIFVTDKFKRANYYGNAGIWNSQEHINRYKPILRFKYDKFKLISDKKSPGDYYTNNRIQTDFEIFVYDDSTKIEYENGGDTIWFDDLSGQWRMLTLDLANNIADGEWDGEWDGELQE